MSARVDTVEDSQEALKIIEEYDNIIKTNKKNTILFAYEQGKIFKRFKEHRIFKNLVEQFKINKSTIIFKINIAKLLNKHPKILTSLITLNFLKSYYKDIKNICKENQEWFSWVYSLLSYTS